tara:strand:- start:543 stop:1445 length:903 start_codon:yes stop_codon:yes gene_type:complete
MLFLSNNKNRTQLQPYKSNNQETWKGESNNNSIIVAKNVYNEIPNNSSNFTPWPKNCQSKQKYKFNANPIRHYRKQYTTAVSFSNNSMIGFLDKPGNYIVTNSNDCKNCGEKSSQNINITLFNNTENDNKSPQPGDWSYDSSKNKMNCIGCNPQSMVIKRATTVIEPTYCASNKEYLYKKCKTVTQNLPNFVENSTQFDGEGTMTTASCNKDSFNCKITFNPSNQKYKTQGPITSSSRISALKYACNDETNKKCYKNGIHQKCETNDKDCKTKLELLQSKACYGCLNDKKLRRKRINILK